MWPLVFAKCALIDFGSSKEDSQVIWADTWTETDILAVRRLSFTVHHGHNQNELLAVSAARLSFLAVDAIQCRHTPSYITGSQRLFILLAFNNCKM